MLHKASDEQWVYLTSRTLQSKGNKKKKHTKKHKPFYNLSFMNESNESKCCDVRAFLTNKVKPNLQSSHILLFGLDPVSFTLRSGSVSCL